MMTPNETKQYIEHRLRELGWGARIDSTGYEKIHRFTDGTEAGANQICFKLLSLGSLQPNHEITDDLVNVALDDLTRMDDIVKRSSKAAASNGGGETDGVSIEQLAAVLEAKVSTGELANEVWTPPRVAPATPPRSTDPKKTGANGNGARPVPPRRNAPSKSASAPTSPAKAPPVKERERSPVVTSADRFAPERGRSHSYPPSPMPQGSLLQRLYHFSSTATITLSATVLVVVAIAVIMFINRNLPEPAPSTAINQVPAPAVTAPEPAAPTPAPVDAAPATPAPPVTATRSDVGTAKEASPATAPKPVSPSEPVARSNTALSPVATEKPTEKPVELTKSVPPASAPASAVEAKPAESTTPATSSALAVTETQDAAARAAPRPKIAKEELSALLRRFAFVYEAGDADQFANLFSENARTNDKSSREGIRADYQNFFGATDLRQMNLGQVNWEVEENQAQGWGNFDVTVRRAGEQEVQAYSGSLSFNVEKVDGRLRIVRLYHGQRRAGM